MAPAAASQLVEHGLQQRGVEGVGDLERLGADPFRRELLDDGLHERGRAGHDGVGRAVVGGDADLAGVRGDGGLHLLGSGEDRGHGAAGRQALHQAAARGHQGQAVLQRQDAREDGGGVLADAVAEHRARA